MSGEGECCPRTESLTLSNVEVVDKDEITLAVWESCDLIKKTMAPTLSLKELVKWVTKWILHYYTCCAQAAAIHEAKKSKQRGNSVLHFDIVEN